MKSMKKNIDVFPNEFGQLIIGMRNAYEKGENAMAYARDALADQSGRSGSNQHIATLVAYDLQAGTYVERARENPEFIKVWCKQLADLIEPVLPANATVLEVGAGEATTLAGVLEILGSKVSGAFGFDISWSRIKVANDWLAENSQSAEMFVGDLFHIPLADNSVDVVYSSHSLEPNGGLEAEAITECLRVARRAVVLVEPIYELASSEAQARMRHHGYVRGLRETALSIGAEVMGYQLLDVMANPLNPSGVLSLRKVESNSEDQHSRNDKTQHNMWQCPLTRSKLTPTSTGFVAQEMGIVYPILEGVPLLGQEHSVVASKFRNRNRSTI